jgi:polar amino acid transport system ATP-binding protein
LPHLEVSNLSASYGSLAVLHDVSLSFEKGEVVALIGPSGSGKSTILRVLMGLTPCTSGTAMLDGKPIDYQSAASVRAARDRMAIVFQQYNLFQNMDVIRNVTIAPVKIKRRPHAKVEAEALKILARVGLAEKAHAYPDQLSGGQQQRVAIARALALKPEILLLDEVTSALDPELVSEVEALMLDLAEQKMPMMIVTHDMWFAKRIATRVMFVSAGHIVEDAPPSEIFNEPKTERTREFLKDVLHIETIS